MIIINYVIIALIGIVIGVIYCFVDYRRSKKAPKNDKVDDSTEKFDKKGGEK